MKTLIKIPRHPVFKSFGILNTLSGTYVCPGWIKVPFGTTRDDIELYNDTVIESSINSNKVKPEPNDTKDTKHKVASSNGKSEYVVLFKKNVWSCTCPASTFRRGDCKHIKLFK